jgi:hypothetical protein
MRKIFCALALVAGAAGAAQAQDVSLGLKAGASLSNLRGADATNSEYLLGFHAGVFANIGLTRTVAFQPELLYSQKGQTLPLVGGSDNAIDRFHYVDVPLAFHINANGLFFEAGPQVGFLVGASRKIGNASYDTKKSYETADYGYLAGLGYQRKTGLGIGLRYNGSFTSVRQEFALGGATIQDRARNSAFQLYLTYSFGGL